MLVSCWKADQFNHQKVYQNKIQNPSVKIMFLLHVADILVNIDCWYNLVDRSELVNGMNVSRGRTVVLFTIRWFTRVTRFRVWVPQRVHSTDGAMTDWLFTKFFLPSSLALSTLINSLQPKHQDLVNKYWMAMKSQGESIKIINTQLKREHGDTHWKQEQEVHPQYNKWFKRLI